MQHWTNELAEGHRIFKLETQILQNLNDEQKRLQEQIENCKKQIEVMNIYIESTAKQMYTVEEITEARAVFAEKNTRLSAFGNACKDACENCNQKGTLKKKCQA